MRITSPCLISTDSYSFGRIFTSSTFSTTIFPLLSVIIEATSGISNIRNMKLHRNTVTVLIGMIAVSLIGLLALQSVLIKNAYELKQQTFRQNVSAAMNSIVQKLETGEAVGNTFRILVKEPHSQL